MLNNTIELPAQVNDPVPITSLNKATTIIAAAKPAEYPNASIIESETLFLLANDSALPNMIQLTTINEMNEPND